MALGELVATFLHVESLAHHGGVQLSLEVTQAFVLLHTITEDELLDAVGDGLVGGFGCALLSHVSCLFFTSFLIATCSLLSLALSLGIGYDGSWAVSKVELAVGGPMVLPMPPRLVGGVAACCWWTLWY